jgi:hypothetical protein
MSAVPIAQMNAQTNGVKEGVVLTVDSRLREVNDHLL